MCLSSSLCGAWIATGISLLICVLYLIILICFVFPFWIVSSCPSKSKSFDRNQPWERKIRFFQFFVKCAVRFKMIGCCYIRSKGNLLPQHLIPRVVPAPDPNLRKIWLTLRIWSSWKMGFIWSRARYPPRPWMPYLSQSIALPDIR